MKAFKTVPKLYRGLVIGFYEASNKENSDIKYLTYDMGIEVICRTPGINFGYDTTWDDIINALDKWFGFKVLEPAGLEEKVIIITKRAEEHYKIAKREELATES